ncbi:type VI secretion system domain-containing protein [Escherichia coli]|uniref:type VI secretion system domain-containing protein n=1 Tax=Escherichia coli TaxID=562 RepID=UPI003D81C2E1
MASSVGTAAFPASHAPSSPVDAPQVQTITSGRDLLDQAKVLARYLNEQPQGWLSAHRLMKTLRWDTVRPPWPAPDADTTGYPARNG